MRIQYSYKNYPNCPRATEYSQWAESRSATAGGLVGIITIAAVICFLASSFSFFGNYNWMDFLGSIIFVVIAAVVDFYYFIIRPNNTRCEIKIILLEDCNPTLPQETIKQLSKNLRKENRIENNSQFLKFFSVFAVSLVDTIALIAIIKGVYLLCHGEESWLLVVGALVLLIVLSCSIWLMVRDKPIKSAPKKSLSYYNQTNSANEYDEKKDIAFCRKCGAKILPDSIFCDKCGTKVR